MRNGKIICHIDYDYDGNGNLVKEFWDFNGKWNQVFHYIYEPKTKLHNYYSSPFLDVPSSHRISQEMYTFNNEVGGPSLYYYNDKGQLNKKVFVRSDSVSTHTFYEYDEAGKLIESKRKYSDNKMARFTYQYDEQNRLVMRNFYLADTLYGFESYLYNPEGELVKAYLKNFDTWLSGTLTFRSNNLGKVASGTFKGENGFDASILFNYNAAGLLSEIHWKFSFGKFQKYSFEYLPADSL